MTVTITAKQRDALYHQILVRLSGIGDVWLAVCAENYGAAERLGRDYSDDLRLVMDDLGWGDGPSNRAVELTTPPEVLRRVFSRLRDIAASQDADEERERAEARKLEEHNRVVAEVCQKVLASLPE